MGLLTKLRSRNEVRIIQLPGGRDVEVKGESFYQDAFMTICGGKCEDGYQMPVTAVLQPEPTSKYDENAVRVLVERQLVGHLAREEAAQYSPVLRSMERKLGVLGSCGAVIVGGWDRGGGDQGYFGIWLNLASPEALANL